MRARCAQRGGLGWAAQVSRFFVSKASCASQGGVGGLFICLRWRSAILRESSSLWQVSQTILLRGASDAHRHWSTQRPRAGVARTDIIRIWPFAPSKTSQDTATEEISWQCSHCEFSPTERRAQPTGADAKRPQRCNKKDTKMSPPPPPARPARRASAPEFGQIDAHAGQRTPPQDQAVHHIHRQVAKLELESHTSAGCTYTRSPSLESQIMAPLAAPPPPVSPPGSPRSITRKFYVFPETHAPDVVPWPERCRSAPSVSIDEVLTTNLTHL